MFLVVCAQDWQPPFACDVDRLHFTPRIQRLNELEVSSHPAFVLGCVGVGVGVGDFGWLCLFSKDVSRNRREALCITLSIREPQSAELGS